MIASTGHIDPLAQRAAIDALEAQRAAYERYARLVESQQGVLNDGDADKVVAFTERAARDLAHLEHGALALGPLVERATVGLSGDGLQDLRRRIDALAVEARRAEAAIRNLTVQLEAWRDALGRKLADVGLVVGGEGGAPDASYPRPGFGRGPGAGTNLIDRKG